MGHFRKTAAALALALAPLCALAQPPAAAQASAPQPSIAPAIDHPQVAAEAAAFMQAYGDDLRAGDRAALARRYHRGGAWRVGHGARAFESWEEIRASYATRWRPPAAFAWMELSYEPLGPDAVVVVGRFEWGRGEGLAPLIGSYTGLLVRQDGELRLRLEDESLAPTT